MRAWYKRMHASGLAEFASFLGTIDRWMDPITNDFQDRQSSGFVEGFNNRVKVLRRRCYGIFDVGRLLQRLTLDLHGYRRFGHTRPHDTLRLTTGIPGEPVSGEVVLSGLAP
jgi:transposase